jgi:hypothetical protein
MSKKKRSHEEDPVKRFDVVLPAAASAQVVRWSVKEGGDVLEGQELCAFLAEGSRDLQFLRSPFPFEGVIRQLHPEKALVSPGYPSSPNGRSYYHLFLYLLLVSYSNILCINKGVNK